nr:unnamed protein product [uncultured bacterium]
MKIYHPMDYSHSKDRIEPNNPGKYMVHAEDFENINDLIARSIITKTPFKPETDEDAYYDTDDDIAAELGVDIPTKEDRPAEPAVDAEQGSTKGERSEAKESQSSAQAEPQTVP